MRQIKFRGLTSYGTWEYGLLAKKRDYVDNEYIDIYFISNSLGRPYAYKILFWTVGQFTGLLDKKGKEIYEGDVVRIDGEEKPAEVYFDTELCEFGLRKTHELFHKQFSNDFEVIGNVYENSDLLEGVTG